MSCMLRSRVRSAFSDEKMSDSDDIYDETQYLLQENSIKMQNIQNTTNLAGGDPQNIQYLSTQAKKNRSRSKRLFLIRCLMSIWNCYWKNNELHSRTVLLGKPSVGRFPSNAIRNRKYNIITFLPLVLYHQFEFFLNLYFLIMAMSQFIPELKIGSILTYWGPLTFVLVLTLIREAIDDIRRYQRDKEVNSQKYRRLSMESLGTSTELVASSNLKVGDIIILDKDHRVPADLILLRTSEKSGTVFIRTDQLDGETDWKLRQAVPLTQKLASDDQLFSIDASIYAEKPQKDIHDFIGTFTMHSTSVSEESSTIGLNLQNTLWSNCVVASGQAVGVIVYTGRETRSVMNNSQPRSKVGQLDIEINQLTKLLFVAVLGLATLMVSLKGFHGPWYQHMFRFVLLFSYIIPLSLRVNLDFAKSFYLWMISKDKYIAGTVVRCLTIPEELGRISYIFTDKTGTLTQNSMVLKRLSIGSSKYNQESFNRIVNIMKEFKSTDSTDKIKSGPSRKMNERLKIINSVFALALCHNVTPVSETGFVETESNSSKSELKIDIKTVSELDSEDLSYQASSPDEMALVEWTKSIGLILFKRDMKMIQLKTTLNELLTFEILQFFPFTSESKRMGIIVKNMDTGEIIFYLKGADVVMTPIVQYSDWLEEECDNMAIEGLRTMIVARKILTNEQYNVFAEKYRQANLAVTDRITAVSQVVESLEREMELICITGVEDKLQDNVRSTLELLRSAGIKIWMLTGDKLETATCIAKSSHIVQNTQNIYVFKKVKNRSEAHNELNTFRRRSDSALIISGASLETCLEYYKPEFLELVTTCPAVVCCRCSPTQKAQVVNEIQLYTGKRTAAIGDGGNDVSMIQQADVGIGIEGREGKQASLAGDFSVTQFCHLSRLLLVHGRYSYKRSANLSQFIIHRGLLISILQAVFSSVFYFVSVSLYPALLLVGYGTIFTMFPVFSLVLDEDLPAEKALAFPEVYKDLSKGRSLSYKTFFVWVLISIYQGGVIMYGALLFFEDEFIHIISISFTALILTELIMVALSVETWHYLMMIAEIVSLILYLLTLVICHDYFDLEFVKSVDFTWKVLVITILSCFPLYILKMLRKKFSPPSYTKLA